MSDEQLPLFEVDRTTTTKKAALLSVDALYEQASQGLLKILKEDRRVERKPPSILKSSHLADYFSMWANTGADGGLIAVGLSDEGGAIGCNSIEVEHLNRLEKEAHDQCPDARVQTKRVNVQRERDGQPDFIQLYRIHFHARKVVHTVRGEAFVRLGESKHKLTHDEITELQNEKGEISIEQETCTQYAFPEDFDQGLIDEFASTMRLNLTQDITVEEIFANRRLGKLKDGRLIPNAACVLVFARDPRFSFPGLKIQLMRFEGEREGVGAEWNAVKHEFIEGPIPVLLTSAAKFLDGQLRDFSSLGPDGRFYSAPEYPRDVWYEALVNALVHRSYGAMKNMTINVKMFDDRLEIESPGGFPIGVSAENIFETISHPRNQFVMEAMWFLKIVRSAAEGTRRMRKLMQDSGLPIPEFRQKEVGHSVVRVVLRNNIKQRKALIDTAIAASIVSPEIFVTLKEDERLVLNHAAEHETINTSQAVRLTGRGWQSAHRLLMRLASKGILLHHHNGTTRDPHAYFSLAKPKSSPDKGQP